MIIVYHRRPYDFEGKLIYRDFFILSIELDKQYHFEDYPEIHNEADIAFVSFLEIPAASATLSTNALLLITSAMLNYLQTLIVRTK